MLSPLPLAVAALGVSAFVTQLVLMRELLAAFAGNELVLGIVLGSWFLLTGLGTTLRRLLPAGRTPVPWLVVGQWLVALAPPASVVALRLLRNVVFVRGAEVGPAETVAATLVLLTPYCLTTGALLTAATRLMADRQGVRSVGLVYSLDSLGGIAGGLLFTFVLVAWLDHLGNLYLPMTLNLFAAVGVAWSDRRWRLAAASGALLAGTLAMAVGVDLEGFSLRRQFPGQEVVFRGHSPYGSLVVTRAHGQYTFVENGRILFATENTGQQELTVHYAMAQRLAARRVLLLGGGASGTAREILKYPQAEVDYVELDPLVIDVARRLLPDRLDSPRIHVFPTDARLYLRETRQRYDVVIVDAPDPSSWQLNRLYTREFFAAVRGVLQPDGVLCFALGQFEEYVGPELARLLASAEHTAGDVFGHVLLLPGGRVRLLASDGPLTADIAGRLEAAAIPTRLVNRNYLRGELTADRLADLRRAVAQPAAVNRDFSPVLYYHHLRYWMSQFRVRLGLLEGTLLFVLAIYLLRIRPVPLAVFASGLTAAVLEVVLLMSFQVLFGSLYQRVGLLVVAFFTGLAAGAFLMTRWLPHATRRHLVWLLAATGAMAALAPAVCMGLDDLSNTRLGWWAGQTLLPLMALTLATLVGMQFPLAGKLEPPPADVAAARLYTADYLGAALGALLVSTWLIPLVGVAFVCVGTALVCVAAAVVLGLGA